MKMEMPDEIYVWPTNPESDVTADYFADKAKWNDAVTSEYHHSRIVEALKAENEELRKELDAVTTKLDTVTSERDELADIIKGMPRYAEELRKTDGYLSGGMKTNLCHDIDKLAKKVNENGNA